MIIQNIKRQNLMNKYILTFAVCVFIRNVSIGQTYPHEYAEYKFIKYEENKLILSKESNFNVFFKSLNNLFIEGGKEINIIHIGGSHIQADIWSQRIRERFFNLVPYSSGGRGLVFPYRIIKTNGAPYVKFTSNGSWKGYRNTSSKHNSELGLAGITAKTKDSITTLSLSVDSKKCLDCSFTSLKLLHGNSTHCLSIDDDDLVSISNEEVGLTTFLFDKEKNSATIKINKEDSVNKEFALYGAVLEKSQTGLQYHSIGVNGASVPSYLRINSFPKKLNQIKPDLAILSIGINDAYVEAFDKERFMKNYDSLIFKIKTSNPDAVILFTTNNDSYYKRKYPNKNAFLVKEAMIELAEKHNGAVWDMFGVMGGLGSIKKWQDKGLAKSDKIHFTHKGYKLIGDLLFEAIINSYGDYVREHL
ncbi:MAG: hypothetical protein CL846_00820 [Crocinitomicaceae bacterium]|nr:hypothetical protein [Crocinitomicaceae bacterium]|tara:strand:+ start:7571 stop:8824 length:1254 start_codon:yes stop_codon:yes gene_type:complete